MTKEILAAVRKKQRMWKETKQGASVEDYKKEDKKVKNMIRRAKNSYERKIAEAVGNNKPFYAYVKRKSKCRPEVGPLKDKDGKTVADADMPTRTRLSTIYVSKYEVKKKIRKLRSHAAAGPDEIGPRLLQELEDEISGPLTMIFRASLETGDVPEDWRSANVTPIYKKGAKGDAANYRPVSLTSVSCKILESIIKDKITQHLEVNDMINPSQHGFRSGRSCCTNLLEFLDAATRAVDEGESVDVVFLDFAKAFDKVPHKRLGEKMRAHGLSGDIWRWITNWLSGRQRRVVLTGRASTWKEVLSGGPIRGRGAINKEIC